MIIPLALPLLARSTAVHPGILTNEWVRAYPTTSLPLFNLAPRGDCSFHPYLSIGLAPPCGGAPRRMTGRLCSSDPSAIKTPADLRPLRFVAEMGVTHRAHSGSPDFPPANKTSAGDHPIYKKNS